MKKKERGMPDIVFVGPPARRAKMKYVVFKILSCKDGVPRELEMIPDDETVDIEEGMEFMTGYVPDHMTRPKESP